MRRHLAQRIVSESLNVREVEALVQGRTDDGGSSSTSSKKVRDKDADTKAFEKELTDLLGSRSRSSGRRAKAVSC